MFDSANLQSLRPESHGVVTALFATPEPFEIEKLGAHLPLVRRRVQAKEHLFQAGQPFKSLYLVHAGFFKTCVVSEDGREKVTGFRMRGDLLGIDALGTPTYACDAVALDLCEVWELPRAQMANITAEMPHFNNQLTALLASEIRRGCNWMLTLGTLNADQRVAAFLLDMGERQRALKYSPTQLTLRMTRAELGSFLALQLETVTRVLSRMDAAGIITVERRQIRVNDPAALRAMVGAVH